MIVQEVLNELESLGDETVRDRNSKNGAGVNQYGVRLGEIRRVAKKIKTDHPLGLELWETGNVDAQFLAILIMKPKELSHQEADKLIRTSSFQYVADWLINYIIKKHPGKEDLRAEWMAGKDPMAARAGWELTAERVTKNSQGLDLPALLDRIEAEMGEAHPLPQWTMNNCLAAIGISHPQYRDRALAIGEALGVYRDYPVSKGCTSPFAPAWIGEMVRRQES